MKEITVTVDKDSIKRHTVEYVNEGRGTYPLDKPETGYLIDVHITIKPPEPDYDDLWKVWWDPAEPDETYLVDRDDPDTLLPLYENIEGAISGYEYEDEDEDEDGEGNDRLFDVYNEVVEAVKETIYKEVVGKVGGRVGLLSI